MYNPRENLFGTLYSYTVNDIDANDPSGAFILELHGTQLPVKVLGVS